MGANILEGKGKGLFIATGISVDFCCGNWTLGEGVDTSVWKSKRKKVNIWRYSYLEQSGKNCICEKLKTSILPGRVVEMWAMGTDSRMLLDMGTCTGTLQGSGGSSKDSCCSAGLSQSSVLLGWFWDKDWIGVWDSDSKGATGEVTGGASSDTLVNS